MSLFPIANFVLSILAIIMVGLAATFTIRATKKFTVGEVNDLSRSILLTIYGIFGKLLLDIIAFMISQTPSYDPIIVEVLNSLGIALLLVAVIMITRVSLFISKFADKYGFVD